jgi:beta-glucosidase
MLPISTDIQTVSKHAWAIDSLLQKMTLQEKLGQMSQFSGHDGHITQDLYHAIQQGQVGSVLNEVSLETVNELQRIAVEDTRLGIPLLIGRDVIHGFHTVFPIPLGQAASWSTQTIKQCAHLSALEAATCGVNWTFAPMIDISRDPRWGRVAESLGEDPYLCATLGVAMIEGFQGQDLSQIGSIAACAKHFAGYGAAESGRDYATTNIPENELRNVYLPPFYRAAKAEVATFMSAFSDLNGVPATGNQWLMKEVLIQEWDYSGFVVSDWESVVQLTTHGFAEDDKQAAYEAVQAGVDMEMVSTAYLQHLPSLIDTQKIDMAQVDAAVRKILELKYALALFDNPYTDPAILPSSGNPQHLEAAKQAAIKSCVLLKNQEQILPLTLSQHSSIAIIGPLADDPYEQLGTWIFDGKPEYSQTCLQSFKQATEHTDTQIHYVQGMDTSRSQQQSQFAQAIQAAEEAEIAVLVLGEESILSGEAHCRAEINLPGCQEQLIAAIAETGTPIVLVVMAGRPLTLEKVLPKVDALLYAWHPGTMAGPAIVDLLLGKVSPSGKLPITFPRKVGQIPIYYAQKNSGKPATEEQFVHMDNIAVRAPQTSLGMAATHLDTHFSPLFAFGFGLSYTRFSYEDLQLDNDQIRVGQNLCVTVNVTNIGQLAGVEIVQLYIRDLVGSVTRPIRELKGFKRLPLAAGESAVVSFILSNDDLAFYNRFMEKVVEPGKFHLWVAPCSQSGLMAEFEVCHD